MAPRDHEDDDLTLHDLIEGPTRDLTAARAAADPGEVAGVGERGRSSRPLR